jgi:integrase
VAYAEKRGKRPQPWRVKYRLPSGMEDSESGFKTKAAALARGRDQEARIREGRWTDPNAGNITVSEWIDRWLAMQDVGVSTENNREYLIRRYLRPAWGSSLLNSLSTEQITRWENGLPARTGISRRTARDARSLLCTILGDAAAARPPLIPYNPALRPRNRGRRTGRRLDRGPQKVWATPLQALLVAERAALLSGRDDDFTMVVTMGYTGLRWGETIGLELDFVRSTEIEVEWQLREVNGRFYRLPPKDDSYRSTNWEPCLPVDLPGFLAELIASQIGTSPRQKCACVGQHGGSGRYVFLGPDGGHYRRSNYARRVFRPACDGRHEAGSGRPARLIIADTTIWPGIPVAVWPPAPPATTPGAGTGPGADTGSGADAGPGTPVAAVYTPPRGRGIPVIPDGTPLACWLPLKQGLTPHGLRHSHKTWMAEDGIPEILAEQRLGHEVPGMRGLYAHASERMRDELKAALEARWEDSLRERAAIHPRSPVPLLDELLAPFRGQTRESADPLTPRERAREPATPGDREKMISQIPPKIEADPAQATGAGSIRRASDLVKHQNQRVELRGFEPLTPSMRTKSSAVHPLTSHAARWRGVTLDVVGLKLAALLDVPQYPARVGSTQGHLSPVEGYPPGLGRSGSGRTLTRSGVRVAIAPARSSSVRCPGKAASGSAASAADGRASTSRTRTTEGRVSPDANRICTKS